MLARPLGDLASVDIVRDGLEVLIVVALGGMLWAAVGKIRRGQIRVVRCSECGRPTSRAYPRCPRCGSPIAGPGTGSSPPA
ncbi:MAG: hypothetical protein M3314_02620 [Actinomycetota bacterium]|nr:hypothetical protein [Actinomycetota bacterium]